MPVPTQQNGIGYGSTLRHIKTGIIYLAQGKITEQLHTGGC